jgi:anti-anti-sigma factor
MGIALEESDAGTKVTLAGTVDIACAAEFKRLLMRALSSSLAVHVSLSQATYLDVTAVQLLWAAEHHAQRLGKQFTIGDQSSATVLDLLADSGFPAMTAESHAA